MNTGFTLILMMFCHVVDDYYLQGILAKLKQRDWWKVNAPQKLYRHDYLMAMAMHAFSWAFMIMLPWAIRCRFQPDLFYFVFLGINAVVHFMVDNLKANHEIINLATDQTAHLTQIFITWLAMMEVFP